MMAEQEGVVGTVDRAAEVTAAREAFLSAQQEQQVEPTQGAPVVEPATADNSVSAQRDPETGRFVPKEAEPSLEVPKKFQKPDGSLDEDKLTRSKKALEEYVSMEKEFHSGRGKKQETPPQQQFAAPPAFTQPGFQVPDPLRQQFAQVFNQDPLGTIADVARFATQQANESNRQELDSLKRELRLKTLAEDPGFLEPDVAQEVKRILQEKPHILNGPDPYAEAYEMARGRLGGKRSATAQQTRTPGATLPGGSSTANAPASKSPGSLESEVLKKANSMNPADAAKYLKSVINAR